MTGAIPLPRPDGGTMPGQDETQRQAADPRDRSGGRRRIEREAGIRRSKRAAAVAQEGVSREHDTIAMDGDGFRGVARHVQRPEAVNDIAITQHHVGGERLDAKEADDEPHGAAALRRKRSAGEDRRVEPMDGDARSRQPPELGGAPHVVQVPVRQHDEAQVLGPAAQPFDRPEHVPRAPRQSRVDGQEAVAGLDEIGVPDPEAVDLVDPCRDLHGLMIALRPPVGS